MSSDEADTRAAKDQTEAAYALELRKLDLERFKAKLDFRKSILIGGFVATAIALIPPLFQFAAAYIAHEESARKLIADEAASALDLKRKNEEFRSTFVSTFLTNALNQDIEIRLRLAEYFQHVAPSEARKDWEDYFVALKARRDAIRTEIETGEAKLARLQATPPNQDNQIEQDRLIQHLSWLRGEVGYVAADRSVIRDPRSPAAVPGAASTTVPVDWVEAGRRPMAQRIATAFANAGMGPNQQIAAIAEAFVESNLDPSAASSGGYGLFQLSQHGFGSGFTPEQLLDPDINISVVLQAAKRVASFVSATTVTDAVQEFVIKVSRPSNPTEFIQRTLAVARRAQQ